MQKDMITHSLTISIAKTDLVLDPSRALYWPAKETLFVTDLHLGKGGRFPKEGLAIPEQAVHDDYQRLDQLMQRYRVKHCICLGNLFHSHRDQEHRLFLKWREAYPNLKFTLIEGHHDRDMHQHDDQLNLDICESLDLNPFYLVHDWKQHLVPEKRYALSGRLHPSIRLSGKAKQTIKFPCFWFQSQGAYLPAFGQFAETHSIEPGAQDNVYVVAKSKIIEVNFNV